MAARNRGRLHRDAGRTREFETTRDCCKDRNVVRCRIVVRYSIDGDLRFISHQDTMRLFERALARAGWPVEYTGGFNPRPRLSLPLPRAVGVSSEDELLVVTLSREVDPEDALRELAAQVPAGIRLREARIVQGGAGPRPQRVWYEVPVEDGPVIEAAVAEWLGRSSVTVRRRVDERGTTRAVDIRRFVESMVVEKGRLILVLRVGPEGTARPSEVLEALGLPARELTHRIRRTRVEWSDVEPAPPAPGPAVDESAGPSASQA